MNDFLHMLLDRIGAVADCPPDLTVCQDCKELHCTQAEWEVCKTRLAAVDAAKAKETT